MVYILALLISLCLISGQALWGSAVKKISPVGSHVTTQHLITGLMHSPRLWLGGLFYAFGTLFYFLLLSKVKFFSVQITMTVLAIVFSTILSAVLFHEKISFMNIIGLALIILGLFFVLAE